MGKIRHNFKKLEIWKRAMKLSIEVHKLTQKFPNEEKYALISQMRRAAVSIPSNIAEGLGRINNKSFSIFLHYAIGSAFELETQLIYAHQVNYIEDNLFENFQNELIELQKMITSFDSKLD